MKAADKVSGENKSLFRYTATTIASILNIRVLVLAGRNNGWRRQGRGFLLK
jgi:hypothetical protein